MIAIAKSVTSWVKCTYNISFLQLNSRSMQLLLLFLSFITILGLKYRLDQDIKIDIFFLTVIFFFHFKNYLRALHPKLLHINLYKSSMFRIFN